MKKIKLIKVVVLMLLVCMMATSAAACDKPQWLGGPHTVTISINGEKTKHKIEKNAIVEKPEDPILEGYDFIGWFLDKAGKKEYDFSKPLNANRTIYALFEEKEYVITYVIEGNEQEVTYKWSQTPDLETPKKDSFVFKAWCLDQELINAYEFTAPVRENLTVYAKFVPAYKVQYVIDEESQAEIVETELNTAPIRPKDPVKEGYDFGGWYLDSAFKTAYNFDKVLNPETTIYAKFVEKEYVITYMVGGTDVVLSKGAYKYFSAPTQPATPEYLGQYFFGWYLDAECKQSYDFSYSLKTDRVIYAQFLESKPIYNLAELQEIKDYPAGNYTLQNDINFAGKVWEPIENFSGKLDGNGFKLIALSITTNSSNAGFIQTNSGTVKNLTIQKYVFTANYDGSCSIGALVGTNKGTIENCHLKELNTSHKISVGGGMTAHAGAITGVNEVNAIVKNCTVQGITKIDESATNGSVIFEFSGAVGYNKGTVENVKVNYEMSSVGSASGFDGYSWEDRHPYLYICFSGVVGANSGTIKQCVFNGSMSAKMSKNSWASTYIFVGGLVRINEKAGVVTECYANSIVKESAESCASNVSIGGFVQNNIGEIKDCYSIVDVETATTSSSGTIGGFVAINSNMISTCYSTGSIKAAACKVGGFIANNATNGNVNLCFCSVDIASTSKDSLGVFVGNIESGSNILICAYNNEVSVTLNEEVYESTEVALVEGLTKTKLCSKANLLETLFWNMENNVWIINGTKLPTLAWQK